MRRFLSATYLWILLLPLSCTLIGAGSNQAVLIANGDRFPVLINATKLKEHDIDDSKDGMVGDDVHCVMTKATHLNFLADIFDFHDAIYSIGDLLLELGEWLWVFCPFVWGFAIIGRCYALSK